MAADRVPDGRSLMRPPSYCESCLRPLASRDMFPVFSYLWLRGKCRHCKAEVPIRVLLVEVVTGALFVAVFSLYGVGLDFVVLSACLSLLVLVSLIDLEHGLILNSMVLPSIVLLVILGPFWTEIGIARGFLGDETLAASLANSYLSGLGAFLAFLIVAMIAPAGMGGGDVKFAAVLGLMVGFPGILLAIWVSAVGGGLVAIGLILAGKKGRKDVIPFGPFMALGAAVVLIAGPDLIDWYRDLASAIAGT
ncbi:MAG: prepilin peptidase [Chloroflexi bacterium]|nr:prepilin peptidase [Chloroflexota bacterium]